MKLFNFPRSTSAMAAAVAGALALYILSPFVVVEAGHRGVVTTFGKVDQEVLGEGLHFVIPLVQKVHHVNVQIQKGDGKGDAASSDMQQVHAEIAINFHLIPDRVPETFQSVGNLASVGERIITPAVSEAVKATTAKYTAEQLISKREEVRNEISAALAARMTRHGIAVDEFSIVNFNFSQSFNASIEAKATAEQLSLKAERDLERIKIEAQQKIATAKAEAESLTLQRQAVSPELIALRQAENERLAIEKWNGVLPTTTGGAIPFINVGK